MHPVYEEVVVASSGTELTVKVPHMIQVSKGGPFVATGATPKAFYAASIRALVYCSDKSRYVRCGYVENKSKWFSRKYSIHFSKFP